MIVMHRILTSMISVLTIYRHELYMVLDYWILIRAKLPMFRTRNTNARYGTVTIPNMLLQPTRVAADVECCFRCVCIVICVNLGPKAAISVGEQNRYGSTAGGGVGYTSYGAADKSIWRLTAYEVYGGLWRLTGAAMEALNYI